MTPRLPPLALALAAAGLVTTTVTAAVVDITAATFSPATAAENDNEVVTSITAGSTYSLLQGSTATGAGQGATGADGYYYASAGTNPGSNAAAMSGLTATDGQLNVRDATASGGIAAASRFTFASALKLSDVLFWLELGLSSEAANPDDVILGLVDNSGTRIGTFQLTLTNFGAGNLLTTDVQEIEQDASPIGSALADTRLFGVTFTAGDFIDPVNANAPFTGTNAFGLVVLDNSPGGQSNQADPAVVGRVIPEPGSLALAALGGLLLLPRRRTA